MDMTVIKYFYNFLFNVMVMFCFLIYDIFFIVLDASMCFDQKQQITKLNIFICQHKTLIQSMTE